MIVATLVAVFWLASLAVVFPYVIYPPLVGWLARTFGDPVSKPGEVSELPTVTFIISAFNEERVIEEKLANVSALDYPEERLQIVVVSDASDDATDVAALFGE